MRKVRVSRIRVGLHANGKTGEKEGNKIYEENLEETSKGKQTSDVKYGYTAEA
jgi:hypothetical protein